MHAASDTIAAFARDDRGMDSAGNPLDYLKIEEFDHDFRFKLIQSGILADRVAAIDLTRGTVAVFGRRQPQSFTELKETMRPTPDADGVAGVFPRELWDDPKIGKLLREVGFAPDDARNILPTAEDYIALFAAARKRLEERTEAFNREMTIRHGYCRAVPFLVIDNTIWDGKHGAFLYAQLKLIGYDEWNVLMLAADVRTKEACDLAGHPGMVPAVTEVMTERVVEWKRRYEVALEAYGITATGGQGMTREQFEAEQDALRREIVDNVGWMKPRIISELLRIQG